MPRLVGFSLGLLALFAAVGCEEKHAPRVKVPVAATDLDANYKVTRGDIAIEEMTAEEFQKRGFTKDAVLNPQFIEERTLRKAVKAKGEFATVNFYPKGRAEKKLYFLLAANSDQEVAAVRSGLAQWAAYSRQDHGCLKFEVFQLNGEASKNFLVMQEWSRADDFDAHRLGPNFKEFFEGKVQPHAKLLLGGDAKEMD